MKICVSGFTSSGKSFFCKILAEKFNLKYLSTSNILLKKCKTIRKNEDHFWIRENAWQINHMRKLNPKIDLNTDKEILQIINTNNNIIIDSWIAPYLYTDRDLFKIFIKADLPARTNMAYKSCITKPFTKEELRYRIIKKDKETIEIFKQIYNKNIEDLSVYDLIFDITNTYKNSSLTSTKLINLVNENKIKLSA